MKFMLCSYCGVLFWKTWGVNYTKNERSLVIVSPCNIKLVTQIQNIANLNETFHGYWHSKITKSPILMNTRWHCTFALWCLFDPTLMMPKSYVVRKFDPHLPLAPPSHFVSASVKNPLFVKHRYPNFEDLNYLRLYTQNIHLHRIWLDFMNRFVFYWSFDSNSLLLTKWNFARVGCQQLYQNCTPFKTHVCEFCEIFQIDFRRTFVASCFSFGIKCVPQIDSCCSCWTKQHKPI